MNDSDDSARHVRHELRTPLNAILGYAEMLLEDAPSDSAADTLRKIMRTGQVILDRIDHLTHHLMSESSSATRAEQAAALKQLLDDKNEIVRLAGMLKIGDSLPREFYSDIDEIIAACEKLGELLCRTQFPSSGQG